MDNSYTPSVRRGARMGGITMTEATKKHAEEMLKTAGFKAEAEKRS